MRIGGSILNLPLLVLVGVVIQGCLQTTAGTDVDNAIVAGMVMDQNQPFVGAKVSIMPVDYNPVRGDSTGRARSQRTSPDGTFRFMDLSPGSYALEAMHSDETKMDWIDTLVVPSGQEVYAMATLNAVRVLFIVLPADAPTDAYLYVPGSNVYAMRTGQTETILEFHHVPQASLPQIIMSSMAQPELNRVLFTDVPVTASDTLWAQ